MRLNSNKQQGFTLIEVTIILLVLVILSTIMLPQLGNFNRLARFVKVREDVGAICASVKKMLDEVMLGAVYENPRPNGNGSQPIGLLLGPGSTPLSGSVGDGNSGIAGDGGDWQQSFGATFDVDTDDGAATTTFKVDRLEYHLQQNNPLNGAALSAPYKNALDNPDRWAAGAFFGWRGPYLDELTTDPWGNRYAVNSFALYKPPSSQSNDTIYSSAVVCYSAGPDQGVDTVFNQPMDDADGDGVFGWVFGDDDLGAVLSAGGPF